MGSQEVMERMETWIYLHNAVPSSKNQKGFTLLELILVIALVAIISTLAASRVDSIIGWKHNRDVRRFISLWQFLNAESISRRETYRLYIDLDKNVYYVKREIPIQRNPAEIIQVDYLSNLRTKGEKERRAKEKQEDSERNLKEQFQAEDIRRKSTIEDQFYQFYYNDVSADANLGTPLEFPSLADKKELTEGLVFKDVKLRDEVFDSGLVFIRFSARGFSDFAVVHMELNEESEMTILMDPSSGKVALKNGREDFDMEDFDE